MSLSEGVERRRAGDGVLIGSHHPRSYGVYLKLLMYMQRVIPMVAKPPQLDELVPQKLKRNGAVALGTAPV
jgi:hypothetical protein